MTETTNKIESLLFWHLHLAKLSIREDKRCGLWHGKKRNKTAILFGCCQQSPPFRAELLCFHFFFPLLKDGATPLEHVISFSTLKQQRRYKKWLRSLSSSSCSGNKSVFASVYLLPPSRKSVHMLRALWCFFFLMSLKLKFVVTKISRTLATKAVTSIGY